MSTVSRILDVGQDALTRRSRYLLIFSLFFAIGIGQGIWSLRSPFEYDDFHLIRVYSRDELEHSFRGTWDPDGIETPGYRPLTTLFNHGRACLFGESVAGHRLFLLGLFSFYLTLVVILAHMMGASYWQGVLGGILAFLHTTSVYHYAWISDGIHLLSGIFIIASVVSLFLALERRSYWWLAVSLELVALALLTREDSLVVYPLSLLLAVAFMTKCKRWARFEIVLVAVYVTALIAILAILWRWRSIAVPQASGLAGALDLHGWEWLLLQTVQILGDSTRLVEPWPTYISLIWWWTLCLGGIGAVFLFLIPESARLRAALWAGCVVVAATPGLVMPRSNLLLLSVTFFGLFLATVLVEFSHRSRLSLTCSLGIMLFIISSSYFGSMIWQRERNSANLDQIYRDLDFIYNSSATIPEVRRTSRREYLRQYGIHSAEDRDTVLPDLIEDAEIHGRYGPNQDGLPFIPRFSFITYAPYIIF